MTINFTLPVGAFSVNQMAARDQRFKTAKYKDWATRVLHYLSQISEFQAIKEAHALKGGTFFIQIIAYYPGYVYFNKQGQISSKTVDCSNFSKPILDLIFGDTLGINDKYVTKLIEEKRAGANYSLDITLILN